MSQLFSRNAYGVLGLDTSTSQKEATKRSKEIIVLVKNDQKPDYDTDLNSINNIARDEASVNDAVQRLSSPIKRIKEYFFWFEIENDQDEGNLELLRDNQYDEALDDWKKRAEKSHTAKRNLAIASSLLLNHTGYKKYLKLSVEAWDDIVNSNKFWSHFEKVYALNDEIGTSKSALDDFRSKALDYLSDFYTDVSRRKKDNSIYAAFSSAFATKGQKVQDEVLAPLFEQINNASDELRELNASQDNTLSSQESMAIKRLVKKIQTLFQEIKDLGLYEDSHSKVMRDKAAEAINIVAVDLYNNLDEDTKSAALIKIAKSLAAGPAVISQINKNVEVMSHSKIIDPINDLIENEQYQKALNLINEEQAKHKSLLLARERDTIPQTYFTERIQWCVTALALRDFKEAEGLFEAKSFVDAELLLGSNDDFIYSYIDEFDIDKESLDSLLETLRNKLMYLNANTLSDGDSYRQQILENSDFDKKSSFERDVISMLLDSAIYQRMCQLIPEIKKQNNNNRIKNIVWKIVGWGAVVGFIVWKIVGWGAVVGFIALSSSGGDNSYNNGSSGTSSSSSYAWQTCSNEYESLLSQLDSVESMMNSYDSSGNIDAYNDLVPRQNSLVNQVNSKATECNNLR